MTSLNEGLKSAGALAALIEKLYDRVLNMADRRKRRNEIDRLHNLLEKVRIGRTLNMGLLEYAEWATSAFEEGTDKKEFLLLIDQIEEALKAMMAIVEEMADEKDRVILFQSEGFQEFSLVAHGRHNLIQELRHLRNVNDGKGLRQSLERYEALSKKLGELSFLLAKHGRELDQSLS